MNSPSLYLVIALAPLVGALLIGFFGTGFLGRQLSRRLSSSIAILGVLISFIGSVIALFPVLDGHTFNGVVYTWSVIGSAKLDIGFLIDPLSALMMVTVSFVSLMVHVFTIGYMEEDPGYSRFFSYISLFTFSMLMLVMSNNMLQLFFGWEAVGLVSYLLIGFWYTRPKATFASLKAFLVNRVGDFGFIVGIGLLFAYAGSMNYAEIFPQADKLGSVVFPGTDWQMVTVACISLFVGAMGKSAQVPLHTWLPDSMEGPTPISALIHAATMVTAGIFMVARFSPVFEQSATALSVMIIIGAIGALFMGMVGIVQNDIKRVVAYSTLSQLGYMTAALGASAYSAAIFHLMTHAFFKALLFLAAGSVIMAMHHDQDIRNMGGLRKHMPVTALTFLLGTLALVGTPFFSGYYSKEHIIEAIGAANVWGSGFSYWATVLGVFVTSLYSFRVYFLVFHGKEHFDAPPFPYHHPVENDDYLAGIEEHHHEGPPRESPWVVTVPLSLLAIASVITGAWFADPLLFGNYFHNSIVILPIHPAMAELAEHWHGWVAYGLHGFVTVQFWLMMAGLVVAWYCYLVNPAVPAAIRRKLSWLYSVLINKYYFDWLHEQVAARGARALGHGLWQGGDRVVIDGVVNGSWRITGWLAFAGRLVQSGFIYHYAFAMVIGIMVLLTFFVMMVH